MRPLQTSTIAVIYISLITIAVNVITSPVRPLVESMPIIRAAIRRFFAGTQGDRK